MIGFRKNGIIKMEAEHVLVKLPTKKFVMISTLKIAIVILKN